MESEAELSLWFLVLRPEGGRNAKIGEHWLHARGAVPGGELGFYDEVGGAAGVEEFTSATPVPGDDAHHSPAPPPTDAVGDLHGEVLGVGAHGARRGVKLDAANEEADRGIAAAEGAETLELGNGVGGQLVEGDFAIDGH